MNIIEKRDYIHSHLVQLDDKTIDEFYEKLRSALEKEPSSTGHVVRS